MRNSVPQPCPRPKLPQGLEAETAATAGIRGVPGTARAEPQGDGHGEVQKNGKNCSSLGFFPGCQDAPIWFPVRSQIYLQAEKSTLVFLGNSFCCVPVGVSF